MYFAALLYAQSYRIYTEYYFVFKVFLHHAVQDDSFNLHSIILLCLTTSNTVHFDILVGNKAGKSNEDNNVVAMAIVVHGNIDFYVFRGNLLLSVKLI